MAYSPNLSPGQKNMAGSAPVVIASDQSSIPVTDGFSQTAPSTATWNASTTVNTALAITCTDYSTIVMTFVGTGSAITGGVLTFEVYDGANWFGIQAARINAYTVDSTYVLSITSQAWEVDVGGWQQFRIRLSTAITGTTPSVLVTLIAQAGAADPSLIVGQSAASQLNATVIGQATGSGVPATGFYESGRAATALPTAASAGNLVGAMYDKFGRLVVLPGAPRDLVSPITLLTLSASTSETSLIAATASTFHDIVSLVVINTSATATRVDFRDSTAGTIRLSLYVPAGDTRGVALPVPLPQAAVNTAWTAECGTSVSSVVITGTYISNA
jgi:hypothetical protein